jgi:hypothetical protein
MKEAALRRKTQPDAAIATITPPRAGPVARAMLILAALRATAEGTAEPETVSGSRACHAGNMRAVPSPMANVKASRTTGVTPPASVREPRAAATSAMPAWVPSSRRRRSVMSARAPASSPIRNMGR